MTIIKLFFRGIHSRGKYYEQADYNNYFHDTFCFVQAFESYEICNNSSQAVFKLNFYSPDDGVYLDEGLTWKRGRKMYSRW